jgi:tRNA (guanine9-N1)-methyltransferase
MRSIGGETSGIVADAQVFEILTKYLALNDWRQAFESVIPNRKYDELGKKALRRQQRRARFAESNAAEGNDSAEVANVSDDSDEDDIDDMDDEEYDEEVDDEHHATEAESGRAIETSSIAAADNKGTTSATNDDLVLDEEESMNM